MQNPFFSIIVLNYNSGKFLSECLIALLKQTNQNFEVIVADNGSSDNSFKINREVFGEQHVLNFLDLGKNYGFALGNNLASKSAQGQYLIFLNPDAIPNKNWLEEIYQGIIKYPKAKMFGATQISAYDKTKLDGAGDCYFLLGQPYRACFQKSVALLPTTDYEVFAACGASMAIEKAVFEQLEGFDADYFMYGEDVDLSFRLRLLGYKVMQLSDACVFHYCGADKTSLSLKRSHYHGVRNLIYTFFKDMPTGLFYPLLPLHLLYILFLLARSIKNNEFSFVTRGVCEAFINLGTILKKRAKIQRTKKCKLRDLLRVMVKNPITCFKRDLLKV